MTSPSDPTDSPLCFDDGGALLTTNLDLPLRRGKVRDVYDLGDRLLIISSDRISAFDYILPVGIPEKGRYLTRLSTFWFEYLRSRSIVDDHLISSDIHSIADELLGVGFSDLRALEDRCMITKKCDVIPFECVVRGYLEGSGLQEYESTGMVCGISLPAGLQQASRLPAPIFTPATKADEGHDENVPESVMVDALGEDLTNRLRDLSLEIYSAAAEHALECGLIIADTKFEFGHDADGRVTLIDEVLTADSSRFWELDDFQPGRRQRSFDKQFVRQWLMDSDWDRNSPPPPLPPDIISATEQKYASAVQQLRGNH
ncbi:MAG: phosphoribosylaminoimidazolesuccinocarboxamide synthase [Planctomycetota bacterium]